MPGFNIHGEGNGPNSLAEVRRTHRWIFEGHPSVSGPVMLVLQKAARPNMTFEEPVMHHNQEQVYFAGKHSWESIGMSYYDVEQSPDVSAAMWAWMNVCMSLVGANAAAVQPPSAYKAQTVNLNMQDGMGNSTETWAIYNGWPQNINWGGLDYTSTELQLIEVKYRFDRAVKVL